jgi:hypothetical protein
MLYLFVKLTLQKDACGMRYGTSKSEGRDTRLLPPVFVARATPAAKEREDRKRHQCVGQYNISLVV